MELSAETFFNPKLLEDITNTVSASMVIQLYTQIIQQQDYIELKALPNLPDLQKTAREKAKDWKDKILPDMAKTTAGIIEYAKGFKWFNETLLKRAPEIHNDDDCKTVVVEGLKQLQIQVQNNLESTKTVINKLSEFYQALAEDSRIFYKQYHEALVKIQAGDTKIEALGKQLDAIQYDMDNDICSMATNIATIFGIAMFIIGVILLCKTPENKNGNLALLIGGAIVTVGGGCSCMACEKNKTRMKLQKEITETQVEDKQKEMMALKSVRSSLEGFLKALRRTVTAAQNLLSAWQSLGANLTTVIDAIERTNPDISPALVVSLVNTVNANWQDALEKAKKLQPAKPMKIDLDDNLQDSFNKAEQ